MKPQRPVVAFRAAASLALWCFSSAATAQDNCSNVLSDGIFDTRLSNVSLDYASVYARHFCNESIRQRYHDGGAYFDMFRGTFADDKYTKLCESVDSRTFLSTNDLEALRSASAVLVDAWSKCMDKTNLGARFSLEQLANLTTIRARLRYTTSEVNRTGSLQGTLTIPDAIDFDSCTCDATAAGERCEVDAAANKPHLHFHVPNNGDVGFTCERASRDEIVIAPSANYIVNEARLPAIKRLPGVLVESAPVVKSGRCADRDRPTGSVAVSLTFRDIPESGLRFTVARVGPMDGSGSAVVSFPDDCDARFDESAKCTLGLGKQWLTGSVGGDNTNGLWLEFPHSLGSHRYQVIKQAGNRDCAGERYYAGSVVEGVTLTVTRQDLPDLPGG